MYLAPLHVRALAMPPRGFQPSISDQLVGPSFARDIVQRHSARLLPKAALEEALESSGLSSAYVDSRVGAILGAFASSFRAWCDQVPKKEARRHCGVFFTIWKWYRDQRLIIDVCIPNTAFEAPDPVALATGQSFSSVKVYTNEPVFVSGVDIQVVFNATGLLEALSSDVRV